MEPKEIPLGIFWLRRSIFPIWAFSYLVIFSPLCFPLPHVTGHTVTFSILSLSFTVSPFRSPTSRTKKTTLPASLSQAAWESCADSNAQFSIRRYQEFYDGKFKEKENHTYGKLGCVFLFIFFWYLCVSVLVCHPLVQPVVVLHSSMPSRRTFCMSIINSINLCLELDRIPQHLCVPVAMKTPEHTGSKANFVFFSLQVDLLNYYSTLWPAESGSELQ